MSLQPGVGMWFDELENFGKTADPFKSQDRLEQIRGENMSNGEPMINDPGWRPNQMMNKPETTGGIGGDGSTTKEYCGRCGKPKEYIGDYYGQAPPPWCVCPPLSQWRSGQFKAQGWECPNCNRVYAPGVDECLNCRPPKYEISGKSTLVDVKDLLGIEDDESN